MHNHGDSKQCDFNEDEGEEEEVTFLLRLKPAPTPPTRRRKPPICQTTTPKGWDVVIERPPCSSMKESRFSLDAQDGRGWNQTNNFQATAIKPSAPPHEPWDPFWWSPTALGAAVVGKPPKALQRKSGAMEKSTLPLDNGVNATFTSPVASQGVKDAVPVGKVRLSTGH
ncbi:hypothetical protein HUJ05_000413 [Dendroctonus ponderosae]|nr:hypothetical protein HUJ05_000413 [Dendroctonus ponderosae]